MEIIKTRDFKFLENAECVRGVNFFLNIETRWAWDQNIFQVYRNLSFRRFDVPYYLMNYYLILEKLCIPFFYK